MDLVVCNDVLNCFWYSTVRVQRYRFKSIFKASSSPRSVSDHLPSPPLLLTPHTTSSARFSRFQSSAHILNLTSHLVSLLSLSASHPQANNVFGSSSHLSCHHPHRSSSQTILASRRSLLCLVSAPFRIFGCGSDFRTSQGSPWLSSVSTRSDRLSTSQSGRAVNADTDATLSPLD